MKNIITKNKIIIITLFIFAILIRVVFVCKTNISDLQFDVGIGNLDTQQDYDNLYKNYDKGPNEGRHINYIFNLYYFNSLPTKIIGQFYHPPLHHFIMACWLKVLDIFSNSSSFKLEAMQYITLAYSIIILVALYKLLKEFDINDKNKIIPMLLFSFYPLFIFFSGSINNDELVTMFAVLFLLYLVKWNKKQSIKNTFILSLCMGLGLMTKISMYMMFIPAIYIFFKKLIQYVKENKKTGILILELFIFSVISLFLGMWFQISRYFKGLETFGIIQPYEHLSLKNESLFSRFGFTNLFRMNEINIWNYLIYSSLNFGLTLYNNIFIKIMIIPALLLILDVFYFSIKNFKTEKLLIITFFSWIIAYLILNITMPYISSMHARYLLLPISVGILIIAKGLEQEKNKLIKFQIYLSTIIISILSVITFIFI